VQEELKMEYDSLIDENPDVQARVAQGEQRGELRGERRGERRGELRASQIMVLDAVHDTYPSLVELAEEKAPLIDSPEELRKLVRLIYKAPNEEAARWLLDNFAA
jgi:hypothetical protein